MSVETIGGAVFGFLYSKEPFEIAFEIPSSLALRRLQEEVSFKSSSIMGSERITGEVFENKVKLNRHVPLTGNPFKPVMVAEFIDLDGKSLLVGEFRIDRFTQVFMSVWFGGLALLFLKGLFGLLVKPESATLLSLYSFMLLAAGFVMVKGCRWSSKNDKKWLIKEVSNVSQKK